MKDLQPILLPGMSTDRPLIIAGPCSAETEEQVIIKGNWLKQLFCNHKYNRIRPTLLDGREYNYSICSNCGKIFKDN